MLSTNRPHIHSAACWFTWRNRTEKGPCLINIPTAQSLLLSGFFPPLFPLFFDFCSSSGLCQIHPCSPLYCNPFFCYQASSQSPLDSVSKQTGRERVQGRGLGRGGRQTRLLLLVTQTWLTANTSTMFVLPHSLPPTE